MLKDTPLYPILFNKCPRCRKGDFFVHGNAYFPVGKFDNMHKTCSHCEQNLTPEPGFYYGAMYISYSYYTAIVLIGTFLGIAVFDTDITLLLTIMIPILIILTPVIFRLSRRTWLTVFVKYDPEAGKDVPPKIQS